MSLSNQTIVLALTSNPKVATCAGKSRCCAGSILAKTVIIYFSKMAVQFYKTCLISGMGEVGIYRLSGATSEVRRLKDAFDNSK